MSLEKRKILKYLEMKIVVITIVGYRAMSPKPWMAMKRAMSSTAGDASRKSAKLTGQKKTIPMTLRATLPKPSMAMAINVPTNTMTTTS